MGAALSTWELDLFGRIRSLSDKALESYLALDETRTATQLSLVAEVANAYLTLRADQELLALTRDTLKSQQDSFKLTQQSYDIGLSTALDLSRPRSACAPPNATCRSTRARPRRTAMRWCCWRASRCLTTCRRRWTSREAGRRHAAHRLAGRAAVRPAGAPPGHPRGRAPAQGRQRQHRRGARGLLPDHQPDRHGGHGQLQPGRPVRWRFGAWSFTPQITVPIFAGGSLLAGLDLAHVQKNVQIAQYEKAIQSGFREVADALAGRGTLDEQIQAQRLLVDASQRAYDVSDQRFRQGIDNYLSVLDSQRSLYSAQQSLVDARARLSNLVNLYKALGGGWTERTASAAGAAQPQAAGG